LTLKSADEWTGAKFQVPARRSVVADITVLLGGGSRGDGHVRVEAVRCLRAQP
jgi:hypothetical protein